MLMRVSLLCRGLGLVLFLTAFAAVSQSPKIEALKDERLGYYACATVGGALKGEERKAAGMVCLRNLLGPSREGQLSMRLRDAQQLERWDTAWETALPRESEAKAIVEGRCKRDAKEVIYATAEPVSSIFLEVEGEAAFQDIYISTDTLGGGIGLSKPWHRMHPLAVEADAAKFGEPKRNIDNLPVVLFKGLENPVYRKIKRSKVGIVFRRVTTTSEESAGVYGRTVSIIDLEKKKLLGERTEFFWMEPPGFRHGVRARFAICPMVGVKELTPNTFIRKVINPTAVPCYREFSEGHAKLESARRHGFNPRGSTSEMNAYFEKTRSMESSLSSALDACLKTSIAKLPPQPD